MDLVSGVRRVVVVDGAHRSGWQRQAASRMHLAAYWNGVVHRVITDLCVLDITPSGFEVVELGPDVSREQVQRLTEASVRFLEGVA
jgi:3-oxoacid CoA-transferase subunit B